MKINKVNNVKVKDLNFANPYTFPTYSNTTQDNSMILALIAGIRNAGKSTLALNIIELEKKHLLEGNSKVYFISPTKDAKVEYFIDKYKDNFEYVDVLDREHMQEVLDKIKNRVEEWKEKYDMLKLLKQFLLRPKKLTIEELELLEEMNYMQDDEELEDFNYNHPPLSTLIIDDSIGSPMICEGRSVDGKWFQRFVLKHRHFPYYCNVLICTQHIKAVAKYFRTNCNWTILFPFRDFNVLKTVFDEYSILFNNNLDNFLNLMENIRLRNDHSFCSIYYDKIQYVRLGFNDELTFDDKIIEKNKIEDISDCSCKDECSEAGK
jgi:hypothetical protein